MEAVEILKQEGLQFRFELIENKSNDYVLSRLAAADIAVDEPGVWVARFSSEALAAGCIVIGGNNPDYMGYKDNSLPIIQFEADTNNLVVVLRELILNQAKRQELMEQSYNYWKNHYSPQAFVLYFEQLIAGKAKTYSALPNYKDTLLKFALNNYQRLLIRLLY